MNKKIGTVILFVACVGLAIALIVLKAQSDARQRKDADTILEFSNQLDEANININDLHQTNLKLNNDIDTNRLVLGDLTNQLNDVSNSLASAAASLQDAQQQVTNLNLRVSDLEAQNQVLGQRAAALSNNIAALNTQIAMTEMKLATSETNDAFLENELKRQVAEKAELEHKFNDLEEVRAQVRKLRDDMLAARRLAWIREGIDPTKPKKGGQLLMQRPPPAAAAPSPYGSLNVEVGSDGSVHVIPPLTNSAAPATNAPPQ